MRRALWVAMTIASGLAAGLAGQAAPVGAAPVAVVPAASATSSPGPGAYSTLHPARICDTRRGNPSGLTGAAAQCIGRSITGGSSLTVSVESPGFGVPADATAVVVNVTAINPVGSGFVTVYPFGTTRPGTSDLNLSPASVVANLVYGAVGTGGRVSVYASSTVDVAIDLEGYVSPTAAAGAYAGLYDALPSPARICDTRPGNPSHLSGPAGQCNSRSLGVGGTVSVAVAGSFGVPANATAVVGNLTAVSPAAGGYLTAYGSGTARPTSSNVNYRLGATTANRVIVPIGPDGRVLLYSSAATNLLLDVSGYYSAPGTGGAGLVTAPTPTRVCDTRPGNPSGLSGPAAQCRDATLEPGHSLAVQIGGWFGVPSGATAAVLNVTAIQPTTATYLTAYPLDPRPTVSDLDLTPGQVRANLVVATLYQGSVLIYNNAGNTDVAVDLVGWYVESFPAEIDGTITIDSDSGGGLTGTLGFVAVPDPKEQCTFPSGCTYELESETDQSLSYNFEGCSGDATNTEWYAGDPNLDLQINISGYSGALPEWELSSSLGGRKIVPVQCPDGPTVIDGAAFAAGADAVSWSPTQRVLTFPLSPSTTPVGNMSLSIK